MNYMLLIYDREADLAAMSAADRAKLHEDYRTFTESIVKSGHFRAGDPLESIQTATTVRVREGKVLNTDGPFAETREQLGGYYLIEARDLDEARSIAARVPSARIGSIEVRPVMKFMP